MDGRHIVVVGAGNSAMNIAVEGSFRAKSVSLSSRCGQWVLRKYGLPKPQHAPGQSHPVQSERIRERIAAGHVAVRAGIERFDGDEVVFVDGTRAKADLLSGRYSLLAESEIRE